MNKNLIFLFALAAPTLSGTEKTSSYSLLGSVYLNSNFLRQTISILERVYPDSPLTLTLEQIAAGELSRINTNIVRTLFITRSSNQQDFTPELMELVRQHFEHVEHIKLIDLGFLIDEEQEFLSHFHNLKSVKVIESTHTKLGAPSQKSPGTLKWRLLSNQDIVEQRLAEHRDQLQTEASSQTLQPLTIAQGPEEVRLSWGNFQPYSRSASSSSNGAARQTTVGSNNTNPAINLARSSSDFIRYNVTHENYPSLLIRIPTRSRPQNFHHASNQASPLRSRSGIESFISRLNTQRLFIRLALRLELIKALQGLSSTPPNLLNLAIQFSNIYRALIQLREHRQSLSASSTDTIAYSPDQTTFAVPDSERDQIRIYSANSHTGQLDLTTTVSSAATTEESQQRSDLDCESIEEID